VVFKAGLGRLRMGAGRILPLGPKPGFSPILRPPCHGPFPIVPVLMLNGDIDLQSPPESAERAKPNWLNSGLSNHQRRSPRHCGQQRVRAAHRSELPAEPAAPRRTSLCQRARANLVFIPPHGRQGLPATVH
jgi:hypothetical protein